MGLILDVAGRSLFRDGERLMVGGNSARLIEAIVRVSSDQSALRVVVMAAVWPGKDSLAQRNSLQVELTRLGRQMSRRGWPPLLVRYYGPRGGALHDAMLHLAVPIELRNAGPTPLLVPGALRSRLLALLLSHPDSSAVDTLLEGLVV